MVIFAASITLCCTAMCMSASRASTPSLGAATMSSPDAESPYTEQDVPRDRLIPPQTAPQEHALRKSPAFERLVAFKWLMAQHISLFVFYAVLCVIYGCRVEHKIKVPLTHASWYQAGINQILHGLFIWYSTTLIGAMQPIVISSIFGNHPQRLTTPSDKRPPWDGLGPSLSRLWDNLQARRRSGEPWDRTTWDHSMIAAYFAALAALGITTSSLVNIPTINAVSSTDVIDITLGVPPTDALVPPGISHTLADFSDIFFDWYSSTLFSASYDDTSSNTLGTLPSVVDNRVYDIIPGLVSNTGLDGTAPVGYTDFNVACGSVPQVSLSATAPGSPLNMSNGDSQLHVFLSINYTLGSQLMLLSDSMSISLSNASDRVSQLWQPSNVSIRIPSSPLVPGIGRNLILYNIFDETAISGGYGSQVIVDDNGSVGMLWPLDVQRSGGLSPFRTGLVIQVIGCSLSTQSGNGTFDLSTATPSADPHSDASDGTSSESPVTWADWQPDTTRNVSIADTWASMFLPNNTAPIWYNQPISPDVQWSCIDYFPTMNGGHVQAWNISTLQSMYASCHVPTVMEDWLTSWVIPDASIDPDDLWIPSLGDVEYALSSATAKAVYYAALGGRLTVYTYNTSSIGASGPGPLRPSTWVVLPTHENAPIEYYAYVARVTFNPLSLLVGIVLAAALTAIGAHMVCSAPHLSNLDGGGSQRRDEENMSPVETRQVNRSSVSDGRVAL
ncbi:hypothetical protein PENSPDRAFT_752234 [Peniophora sp. CONT]|nr:hypothetical protein PENSPDRAFT_752234 [Peniophora sp. CONT]